ncbi:MAG: Kelch repeat-containing protein [Candidatus Anammoxibacter sp.]
MTATKKISKKPFIVSIVLILVFFVLVGQTLAQTWTQFSPTGGPPLERTFHNAVYNPASNRMIVFGGQNGAGLVGVAPKLNDVWVLENADGLGGTPNWTQLSPTGGLPSGRGEVSFVYDQANNRMIMFAGNPNISSCFGTVNDVWVLSNADGLGGTPNWTQLAPTGTPPTKRSNHSTGYDPATNRMITFGGNDACSTFDNQVWVLTNANGLGGTPNWTQLFPIGTPPPDGPFRFAVYDAVNNRMAVLDATRTPRVWVLEDANGIGTPNWTELSPTGVPPTIAGNRIVYDSVANRMIVLGGTDNTGKVSDEVWILENANGLGGTSNWMQLNPTPAGPKRGAQSLVLNVGTNRMIMFGGNNNFTGLAFNDTWVLTDANGISAGQSPTVTAISPNSGLQGQAVNVTLTGTNFESGMTVNVSGTGVTVSNVNMSSSTSATSTFTISADATSGVRTVSVTTSGGTSNTVNFTINNPDTTTTTTSTTTIPGATTTTTIPTGTGTKMIDHVITDATVTNCVTPNEKAVFSIFDPFAFSYFSFTSDDIGSTILTGWITQGVVIFEDKFTITEESCASVSMMPLGALNIPDTLRELIGTWEVRVTFPGLTSDQTSIREFVLQDDSVTPTTTIPGSTTTTTTTIPGATTTTTTFTTTTTITGTALKADFIVDQIAGPASLERQFTDISKGKPDEWLWDFGDGSASIAQHSSHKYFLEGKYDVSLTVSNQSGSDSLTKEDFITVLSEDGNDDDGDDGGNLGCAGSRSLGLPQTKLMNKLMNKLRDRIETNWTAEHDYIELYNDNIKELTQIVNGNPILAHRLHSERIQFMRSILLLIFGEPVVLSATDVERIDVLLDTISVYASPQLKDAIAQIRSALHSEEIMSSFGISVE